MASSTRSGFDSNRSTRAVSFRSPLTSPLRDGNPVETGDVVVALLDVTNEQPSSELVLPDKVKRAKNAAIAEEIEMTLAPLHLTAKKERPREVGSSSKRPYASTKTMNTPSPNLPVGGNYYRGSLSTPDPQALTPSPGAPVMKSPIVAVPVDGIGGDGTGLTDQQVEDYLYTEKFKRAATSINGVEDKTRKVMQNKSQVPLGAEASMGMEPYVDVRTERRLSYYTQTFVVGIIVIAQLNFVYHQVILSLDDGNWIRMLNVIWVPVVCVFMLFSLQFGLNQIICAVGPIAHMQTNSKYFSAVASPRPLRYPDITIQMPVYKEGLETTILPSIASLEKAMNHYKKAGGHARIFINDDGIQCIPEKDRLERMRVYQAHRIAYVGRPKHEDKARKGLFKKASNMNYCLGVCHEVGELMEERGLTMEEAARQVKEARNNEFVCGGDMRMGDIILLVDSDTRVPEDCLTKVVGEFELTPELGFLQCRTTPLRDQDNYWEDMIAHFTANIYDVGIALAVSAGDPAPLVGHNAFLRWEAIQQGSWISEQDGERKFWSEAHVSEDFDMSLRLQTIGYIGRYATYTGPGFQEGVSLTAADEVIRLRKYAFGACEMVLNRFKDWPCHGLITPMFRSYLKSPAVRWPAKIQMTGYLGTYLAMAYSIYGIWVYIGLRIWAPIIQQNAVNTFDIFMTVLVLFGCVGVFGSGTIRYRMGFGESRTIFDSWWVEIKNAPTMTIFWAHVLWHITTACWNYFWNIPMVWGATLKELDNQSFSIELKNTFVRYKSMYFSMIGLLLIWTGLMIYYDQAFTDIRMTFPIVLYTSMHMLGPILLNPVLVRGYY